MISFHSEVKSLPQSHSNSNSSQSEPCSPSTQNILNAMPQIWSHGLLYGVILIVGILLPWAILAKVDETGTARGRIEIKGELHTKESALPQPVATKAIYSKEGESVQKGQILLELDTQVIQNQVQQLETNSIGQQTRLDQFRILKSQLQVALSTRSQQNQSQQLEKQTQISQAQQSVLRARESKRLQRSESQIPIKQAQKALASQQKTLTFTQRQLETAQKERDRYQRLYQKGIVPEVDLRVKEDQVLDRLRQRQISQGELEQTRLQIEEQQRQANRIRHESEADTIQVQLQLQEQRQSYQSLKESGNLALAASQQQIQELESQMITLKAEIADINEQIRTKQRELENYTIRAPFDGVLQRFPIKKVGTVISPGQLIAQLVPNQAPMIFRAQMPSSQSGFLALGMPVKLKFDAYPFQDYGIGQGTLSWISPDSRVLETPSGSIEIFDLEIHLQDSQSQNNSQKIPIAPGQTATAEIIIRQRRVIDFILDPFKKLQAGEFKL